jgi:hypothetical protein
MYDAGEERLYAISATTTTNDGANTTHRFFRALVFLSSPYLRPDVTRPNFSRSSGNNVDRRPCRDLEFP